MFGHGKLRSKWEGPYLVLDAADHDAVTLQDDDRNIFKVNGQRLKVFIESEMPELEEVDVFELSKIYKKSLLWSSPDPKPALS